MSMDDRKNYGNERLDVFWESLIAGVDACSSLDASLQGHVIPEVTEPER